MCSFIFMNANAQQVENKSSLTIPQIMEGDRFIGYSPSRIQWSDDNENIYFSWNPEMNKLRSTYKVNIESGEPEKVSNEELMSKPSAYADYSKDRKSKVYAKNGDIFIYNVETQRSIQVTNTIESERSPRFFDKNTKVGYQKGGNLYVWNSEIGTTTQITNFKKEKSQPIKNVYQMKNGYMKIKLILKSYNIEKTLVNNAKNSVKY